MEIFKDVVGLTKKQIELIKNEKNDKKIINNKGVDHTVGAKFKENEEESSSGVEYHVNDQEPFYDEGSSLSNRIASNQSNIQ